MSTITKMQKSRCHLHWPKFMRGELHSISVKTGKDPVWYANGLSLYRVKFIVSQAGHRKFQQTGVKSVHAWVEGYHWDKNQADISDGRRNNNCRRILNEPLYSKYPKTTRGEWRMARYNPRRAAHFTDTVTGEPVYEAARAYVFGRTVWYLPYPHKNKGKEINV